MIFSKLRSYEESSSEPLTTCAGSQNIIIGTNNFSLVPFYPLQALRRHLLVATNDMLFLKLWLGIRFNDVVLKL